MEKLNTIIEKISPNIMTFLQFLIISIMSFFANVHVAGKCIFIYMSTYSLQDFSIKNYNKIISEEIEKQRNPVLSNVCVWICVCFCVNILWVIFVCLSIPLSMVILWWVFVWSLGLGLKEGVGWMFAKLKMA